MGKEILVIPITTIEGLKNINVLTAYEKTENLLIINNKTYRRINLSTPFGNASTDSCHFFIELPAHKAIDSIELEMIKKLLIFGITQYRLTIYNKEFKKENSALHWGMFTKTSNNSIIDFCVKFGLEDDEITSACESVGIDYLKEKIK